MKRPRLLLRPQENCKVAKDQEDRHSCLSFSGRQSQTKCLASCNMEPCSSPASPVPLAGVGGAVQLLPQPAPPPPWIAAYSFVCRYLKPSLIWLKGPKHFRQRRYGVIEVADGRFDRVVLRPFPKIVSVPGIAILGGWHHQHCQGDCLRLYYNQPRRFSNFLVLKYVESARDTSMGTLTRALAVLDQIARREAERCPLVRCLELADHDRAARPLGVDAALSVAVPSPFHQAVLRQLSHAAGVVIGSYRNRLTMSRHVPSITAIRPRQQTTARGTIHPRAKVGQVRS